MEVVGHGDVWESGFRASGEACGGGVVDDDGVWEEVDVDVLGDGLDACDGARPTCFDDDGVA